MGKPQLVFGPPAAAAAAPLRPAASPPGAPAPGAATAEVLLKRHVLLSGVAPRSRVDSRDWLRPAIGPGHTSASCSGKTAAGQRREGEETREVSVLRGMNTGEMDMMV